MRRVLLLFPVCFISGCYSSPYYGYYRPPYPPSYPAYHVPGYAPDYGSQNYAPSDQQNYLQNDRPGYASPAPDYGQPTNLAPPQSQSLAPQVENQPPDTPPSQDQNQSQDYGGTEPGSETQRAYCDTPENPIACN